MKGTDHDDKDDITDDILMMTLIMKLMTILGGFKVTRLKLILRL